MADLIEIVAGGAAVAALLAIGWALWKKREKTWEENAGLMLQKVAESVGGELEEDKIWRTSDGLKMRYSLKILYGEEEDRAHQTFSVETGSELEKFFIARPALKKQTEVYPKTERISYAAAKVKDMLESDPDAAYLRERGYDITVSLGGNCISPRFGMFAGRGDLVVLDLVSDAGKGTLFYRIFSGKDKKGDDFGSWSKAVGRGFNMLEKIARGIGGK